jgi:hypothetical protein
MQLTTPRVQYDLIRLNGGLDQVTPTLSLPPGVARRAANFEHSITGGYTRIAGYERFDGHPNPSDALYTLLECNLTGPGAVSVGSTITGVSSLATGKVISIIGTTVAVTRETGAFLSGESLTVGGSGAGTVTLVVGVSADGLADAQYKSLAANDYRADIGAVPGSGVILGVAYYLGTVYAWRNNAAGTAAKIYKSTAAGWVNVPLGFEMDFTTGVSEIADGDTVVGAVSGASATVTRVAIHTGTWGSGDAAGRLVFAAHTGSFNAGESLTVGGTPVATAVSGQSAITLLPSGHVEVVIANFGGGTANYKMYGADSVNRGFEFDGTVYMPISTGMAVDTPNRVVFHKQHLFYSFNASLQFSALGDPYSWVPLLGAGELAMNAEITNLIVLPGNQTSGALGVYTRNDTSVLYGTGAVDFQLSTFNTGTGAIKHTAQNMDQAYVLDDRGVMSLGTTLNFGNFLPASLTMNIRPFIQIRRNLASASSLNREKGQYRLFFSDAYALYMTILNGKVLGSMPVQFANPVLCCVEGEAPDGSATSFFGSDNGFIYRLDAGTSFDGLPIPANINLVYNSVKSPRILKRFRKASVELTGDSFAELSFGYDLAYRSTQLSQEVDSEYQNDLRSAYWDSMTWDNFVWDGKDISPTELEVEGTAENMAIRISSVSAILEPFTVNSIIVHYTPRRGLR